MFAAKPGGAAENTIRKRRDAPGETMGASESASARAASAASAGHPDAGGASTLSATGAGADSRNSARRASGRGVDKWPGGPGNGLLTRGVDQKGTRARQFDRHRPEETLLCLGRRMSDGAAVAVTPLRNG